MQEIKKRRIVLASVLKPVNDVRMFEKFALTLAETSDIHLIGYAAKTTAMNNVTFHPLLPFKRISVQRLLAPWKIFFKTLRLKPQILIITTHELLVIATLVKGLLPCKVIYDVQENYYRNVMHTDAFPKPLRPLLATYIRIKEWFAKLIIDHYLLAEIGYQKEIDFPSGKTTIIENKLKRSEIVPRATDTKTTTTRLIFTGTLSESTGVFTAIHLANALHKIDQKIRLTLIGYAPLQETHQKITSLIDGKEYITLIGGDKLIPHHDIMEAIAHADFGIIAYPPNPATENSIPTKLYEYLGCRLPILLVHHPVWAALCKPFPAAITFDTGRDTNPDHLLLQMKNQSFYTHTSSDVFWDTEGERLIKVVASLA